MMSKKDDFLTIMEKRFAERKSRLIRAQSIAKRIEALSSKKKDALSEAMFCKKHGFHPAHFNRVKKGRIIPSEETLSAIEAALKAERV